MNISLIEKAEQIITDRKLKSDMIDLIKDYPENLEDIMVIMVTKDNQADAYWVRLDVSRAIRVLDSVKGGIRMGKVVRESLL